MKNFEKEIALYRAAVKAANDADAFDHESFMDLEMEAATLGYELELALKEAGIEIKSWAEVMYA